nr:immunoglobulin heavy chain junction region [Mus musculus]
CARAFIHW